jgi:HK97 family phage major capsid protein
MSGYTDQIKELRTKLQTLQPKMSTLYNDLDARIKKLPDLNDTKKADEERAIAADQATFDTMFEEGKQMRSSLDRLLFLDEQDRFLNQPAAPPRSAQPPTREPRKSWGQLVLESKEYQAADKHASDPRMPRVNVKAVYGSTDNQGGVFVVTQRLSELIDIPQRPPSILDLITTVNTTSDAVEYVEQTSRTNNAATVAERTSDGSSFALKPESDVAWTLKTVNVKTIATWIAASQRILADAPMLQSMIDIELTNMLRVLKENQVLSGNGVGENFTGILVTSGIQTRTQGTGTSRGLAGDTVADTLRRAISDVMVEFYSPNGIVLHPFDAEALELDKGSDGHYTMIFDPATGRLWRVAVAQTAAITVKTALVGDFAQGARVWDRQVLNIRIGEPNDMFLRNALAILAEERLAFAVVRPKSFNKVTLT